jgi:hypothetical protein
MTELQLHGGKTMRDPKEYANRHFTAQVKSAVPYEMGRSTWQSNDCSGAVNLMIKEYLLSSLNDPDYVAEQYWEAAHLVMASDGTTQVFETPAGATVTVYRKYGHVEAYLYFWMIKQSVWDGLAELEQAEYGNRVFHISAVLKSAHAWNHFMQSSYNDPEAMTVKDNSFIYSDQLVLTDNVDYEDIECELIPIRWHHLIGALGEVQIPVPGPSERLVRKIPKYWVIIPHIVHKHHKFKYRLKVNTPDWLLWWLYIKGTLYVLKWLGVSFYAWLEIYNESTELWEDWPSGGAGATRVIEPSDAYDDCWYRQTIWWGPYL